MVQVAGFSQFLRAKKWIMDVSSLRMKGLRGTALEPA